MADAHQIVEILRKEIAKWQIEPKVENVGKILEVGDGIAKVTGLSSVMYNEMLKFPGNTFGLALNLEEDLVGAVILGDYLHLKEGDLVESTGRILEVPVGENLIGRVVNPLGLPLDGKGRIETKQTSPIEKIAPSVITREPVNTPLQTGIKPVDALIPIGRGQRELIIGDRSTGKTALAVDTIINQKDQNVICVYVAIGQKMSKVAKLVAKLEETDALKYTIVVVASAADPASLCYIAPYAGCTIGEYFRDKGQDVLVIYDDLSKHAWAYRQISLLLRRPAGREAYPGDIFYLHSRLLERAAKLDQKHGGGSLTALPIIETQAGDISAYIPTNVISITDGQIYLESDLFYSGIRPALNVGLSVSRVGGAAQTKAIKKIAGNLRLELAQYREVAAFAQFSTDLDEATRKQLERGKILTEILKQPQYEPLSLEKEIIVLYAATGGLLDNVVLEKIKDFEKGLYEYFEARSKEILKEIKQKKDIDENLEKKIRKTIEDFKDIKKELLVERKDGESTAVTKAD